MNRLFEHLGFGPADILLPQGCDMTRWSVVACDQYTSQPEYWREVEEIVGDAPSTLRLTLPEVYLGQGQQERIPAINAAMADYLRRPLFRTLRDSFVYVERRLSGGRVRRGLVGAFDLEAYDYRAGSQSLIRATEGTVLERIPPRVKVREHAPLELPHVMVLIDDPSDAVIGPVAAQKASFEPLYDFELMQGGGGIAGWAANGPALAGVARALQALASPEAYAEKYGLAGAPVMAYAVGDGNHSLATAKACWEAVKPSLSPEERKTHPARYALAELVSIHDASLEFEPIHRVVFGVDPDDLLRSLYEFYPAAKAGDGEGFRYEWSAGVTSGMVSVPAPGVAAGVLQAFLDDYTAGHGGTVDYIHGDGVVRELSRRENTVGFLLPAMGKSELFGAVARGGALPRKTFSMGEAQEKRFYLECRRIR